MSDISFSQKTKSILAEISPKKGCCRHAYADATSLREESGKDCASHIRKEAFMCPACFTHFLRGLFVSFGNITAPEKEYHMEFSMHTEDEAKAVTEFLNSQGFFPKTSKRKNRYIVYFKNTEEIEDLLCKIGANSAAFELMNSKIVSEIRNNANRQVNCDSANINKTLNASKRHIEAIRLINEAGIYNELAEELKEAAYLRNEFPEATLAQLGMKFSPPISKSGVSHRLEKIVDFAKNKELM